MLLCCCLLSLLLCESSYACLCCFRVPVAVAGGETEAEIEQGASSAGLDIRDSGRALKIVKFEERFEEDIWS